MIAARVLVPALAPEPFALPLALRFQVPGASARTFDVSRSAFDAESLRGVAQLVFPLPAEFQLRESVSNWFRHKI